MVSFRLYHLVWGHLGLLKDGFLNKIIIKAMKMIWCSNIAYLAAAKSCDNGGEIGDGDEGRAAAVTTCLAAGDSCDCEGGQTDAGDSCCCGECCDAVERVAADPALVVCQLQLAAAEAGDGVEAAEEESCPLLLLRLPPLAAPEARK